MSNREVSDAAEETFPGPGPLRADETKRGIHPVEQMVDAAIDRIAREQQAARGEGVRELKFNREQTTREPEHALALASTEGASTSLAAAAEAASASTGSARRANARLRWKGLDVSEEFRSYADRVASGEDLPPFKGKILAEPAAEFPWGPNARRPRKGAALKRQLGLWSGVALFLGLSVWVLVVQVGKQPDASTRVANTTLSTTLLSNQPAAASSGTSTAPKAAAPESDVPPTAAQPATATEAAPTSASALASLAQQANAGTPAGASGARAAAPAVASTSAGSVRPPVATPAAPPAASPGVRAGTGAAAPAGSVGVFVATRSASPEAAASNASAVPAEPTPPRATRVATASSGPVAAVGPTPTAVPGNLGSTEGVGAHDPKKEPGHEASAMGPLLVETPSF